MALERKIWSDGEAASIHSAAAQILPANQECKLSSGISNSLTMEGWATGEKVYFKIALMCQFYKYLIWGSPPPHHL